MKKIAILLCIFWAFSVSAQDSTETVKVKLSDINFSSGKGALTSGTYIDFNLESKGAFSKVTISDDDIMVTHFFRAAEDKILIGPSAGYYFNTPWAGPQAFFSPLPFLSTFHWVGWTLGEFEEKVLTPKKSGFAFAVNSLILKGWRLEANYCLIHFLSNKPMHTAGIKYSQAVNKKITVYTEIGYNFSDEVQLLKLGINWKQ